MQFVVSRYLSLTFLQKKQSRIQVSANSYSSYEWIYHYTWLRQITFSQTQYTSDIQNL